jgi:hypothetical protein
MPVSVSPAQAFVRLRELGRLTDAMLAKFTPLYEKEVEEEIETFIEVEDDAQEEQSVEKPKKKKKAAVEEGEAEDEEEEVSFNEVPIPFLRSSPHS